MQLTERDCALWACEYQRQAARWTDEAQRLRELLDATPPRHVASCDYRRTAAVNAQRHAADYYTRWHELLELRTRLLALAR